MGVLKEPVTLTTWSWLRMSGYIRLEAHSSASCLMS